MPKDQHSLLHHVRELNAWNPENFVPFHVSGQRAGYLKPFMCRQLRRWPRFFKVENDRVELAKDLGFHERNRILEEVVRELVADGVIAHYLGEVYPLTAQCRNQPLALLDRGAAGYFGIRTYGQHLNGYVSSEQGIRLWLARRADSRIHFPGRLDNMVAGGLPQGLSLKTNLRKECREEADIPGEQVEQAVSVGAVSYCCETEIGLKPDTLFCYDLELPADCQPRNTDGEVSEFMLVGLQEVLHLVRDTDAFKPNCNLVILDFLLRHGVIDPEEPEYLQLVEELHAKVF